MRLKNGFSPQLIFFVMALFFGTWLSVLTPPFQSPDEINHFYKSVDCSNGHWFGTRTNDQRLGGFINDAVPQYAAIFKDRNLSFSDSVRIKSEQIVWSETTHFMDFANTAFYMPFAYLPQMIGIKLAQILDNHVFIAFYLARIFNFIAWLLLVFQAIRIIPYGKWLLVGLALLPASLAFHSSCNPDVMVHGMAYLCLAYALRFQAQKSVIPTFHISLIALMTLFLTIQKIIFFPFVFLFYFHKKTFYKVLFINILMLVSVYFYNKNTFITFDHYHQSYREGQTLNEGVNPTLQLQYIVQNPIQFTKIVLVSFAKGAPSTVAHFVGKYGWEAHYIPAWEIMLLLIGLCVLIFYENNILIEKRQKIVLLAIILCFFCGFSVVMYMLWCPVASPILSNIQGRYFIGTAPIIGLIVNALCNNFYKKIFKNMDKKKSIPTLAYCLMSIWILSNIHLLMLIIS